MTSPPSAATIERKSSAAPARKTLSVYMMDLLPAVPYYTGSLCAALGQVENLRIQIGCNTYYLDRDYFRRQDLRTDAGLLDIASRFPSMPGALRRVFKCWEYLANLSVLLARLRMSRPDIVHIQFLPMIKFGVPVEIWFLRMLRGFGAKLVYTVHNVLPQDTGDRHRESYGRIYRLADRLICHDEGARDRVVAEFQVDPRRISIIPHGPLFDSGAAENALSSRTALGIPEDQCLILWQGILRQYKGVSFLLDAWKRVRSQGARGRLAIVGNGDARIVQEVRDQVASLGLESTVHLDFRFVSVAELADYYNAADVVVYPYREITTSGALMTGIGYGKAIVATRHPAFEQLLTDRENALLVNYGDTDGLADRLNQVIDDAELRTRLGREARKSYAHGPQWPEIAKRTMACYRDAMESTTYAVEVQAE